MQNFSLENTNLRLTFSGENGSLIQATAVKTVWEILSRPHLGLSFRLLVPLPERRNNQVYGEKQQHVSIQIGEDGKSAVFSWDGLESEYGGFLDIKLQLTVKMTEDKAIFSARVENHSPYTVENVYYPYLGDVQPPDRSEEFYRFLPAYGRGDKRSLWPKFENQCPYHGADYPTQIEGWHPASGTPMVPFTLLQGEYQGLYAGIYQPSPEFITWSAELRPGYSNSINARVPEELYIGGKEVSTRFAAIHIPYILPGETRSLPPVALQAYEGGWQAGADIYKAWRSSWMKTPEIPEWAAQPHAWQQLHINSPEDELRIKYKDLPKVGETCAKHGVKAIQLVGWNDGGQDQGNPSHDTDDRLGTYEELKDAIAKMQAMGVKVVLFTKYTWADIATDWYRKDLFRLSVKDPYGDFYWYPGYRYQTATQLLDINTKRFAPMCFLAEEYLEICNKEFQKTLDLGADGILFDECTHHGSALLCFDESHGHRYGAPVYANDRKLIQNFSALLPGDKEFLFAGEACYDWEFETYHLSYFRSEDVNHIPLSRYLVPDMPIMTAVTGFNDRNMINQCLMYRYIISYEPYNFKGSLDDYPLTMEYGTKMDALRTELREYFWDGEFRHEVGAAVLLQDGTKHHPYSVFLNRKTGKLGLVVCNYSYTETIEISAQCENGQEFQQWRLLEEDTWHTVQEGMQIPPCSAAVIF